MRTRIALIVSTIATLSVLIPALSGTSPPKLPRAAQEAASWKPLPPIPWHIIPSSVPPTTTTTVPPTTTTTTSRPAPVVSSPPVSPPTSPPVTSPPPVVSSGDLLLSAPAYVQAAFSCIAGIESNHEPGVVNSSSGDGGLYQFNPGTWQAVLARAGISGYPPRAEEATVAQQDTGAFVAWQQDGFGPWTGDNRCWS
jgi:hypothetical protein